VHHIAQLWKCVCAILGHRVAFESAQPAAAKQHRAEAGLIPVSPNGLVFARVWKREITDVLALRNKEMKTCWG
jgi:hypothetical protein